MEPVAAPIAGSGIVGGRSRLMGVSFRSARDCVASSETDRRHKLDFLPAIPCITGACERQRRIRPRSLPAAAAAPPWLKMARSCRRVPVRTILMVEQAKGHAAPQESRRFRGGRHWR